MRRPLDASSSARARTGDALSVSTISGAPITHEPWPSKLAALHLRADENGTAPVRVHPGDVELLGQRDRGGVAVRVVGERAERLASHASSSPPSSDLELVEHDRRPR